MSTTTRSNKALMEVRKAIAMGQLKKLDGSIPCVDCSAPAKEYDHRDYTKPLEVEPVCRSCNHKRGPALGKDKVKRFNIKINATEHKLLKVKAASSGMSIQNAVIDALFAWMKGPDGSL